MQKTNNKDTIICLGHNENALMFNAIGIKGLVIHNELNVIKKIEKLINEGIKIFFVSDVFTKQINEYRASNDGTYPIFLLLPLSGELNGKGVDIIRNRVEKAIGINLF